MNTTKIAQEKISAFADGEATGQEAETALLSLRDNHGRSDWELYHRIGEVLRSDDMDVQFSPGFAARMAARLEKEPPIVAPSEVRTAGNGAVPLPDAKPASLAVQKRVLWGVRRSRLAAAAVVAVTFVSVPYLFLGENGAVDPLSAKAPASTVVAQAARAGAAQEKVALAATMVPEGVSLSNVSIEEYLLAHQRFSPSLYSAAQYARAATFATESDK